MRLLLDTHIFLWWRDDSPQLPGAARAAILDRRNEVLVSAAVAWEIVIKRALGRLRFIGPVEEAIAAEGFTPLSITSAHTDEVAHLPLLHRDPFDRLLIAQAQVEGLTLVSADAMVEQYPGHARLPL